MTHPGSRIWNCFSTLDRQDDLSINNLQSVRHFQDNMEMFIHIGMYTSKWYGPLNLHNCYSIESLAIPPTFWIIFGSKMIEPVARIQYQNIHGSIERSASGYSKISLPIIHNSLYIRPPYWPRVLYYSNGNLVTYQPIGLEYLIFQD